MKLYFILGNSSAENNVLTSDPILGLQGELYCHCTRLFRQQHSTGW